MLPYRRNVFWLTLLALVACGHSQPFVWVDDLEPVSFEPPLYRIRPGDKVSVSVWSQEHLSAEAVVRADGNVTLPLLGDVVISGATTGEAADRITQRLVGLVVDPQVTVALVETTPPTITVLGEVRQPGTLPLSRGERLLDALARAGGLTEFASKDEIFVLRQYPRPLRIRFDYGRLTFGEGRGATFELIDGDVVVVR